MSSKLVNGMFKALDYLNRHMNLISTSEAKPVHQPSTPGPDSSQQSLAALKKRLEDLELEVSLIKEKEQQKESAQERLDTWRMIVNLERFMDMAVSVEDGEVIKNDDTSTPEQKYTHGIFVSKVTPSQEEFGRYKAVVLRPTNHPYHKFEYKVVAYGLTERRALENLADKCTLLFGRATTYGIHKKFLDRTVFGHRPDYTVSRREYMEIGIGSSLEDRNTREVP